MKLTFHGNLFPISMPSCAGIFPRNNWIELAASAAQEDYRARYNRVFDVRSDGLYRKGLRFKQR